MDADVLRQIDTVKAKAGNGFFWKNLNDMISILHEEPLASKLPTASFVLCSIFQAMASNWDERPVTAIEVRNVSDQLIPSLAKVLELMRTNPTAELLSALDQLVMAFMKLRI